jgi:predicted nucleic acid-binding protein
MRYLLDTDWVIHYLRGHQRVIDKVRTYQSDGLAISVITLAELQAGVYYSSYPERARQGLNDFLSVIKSLLINEEICDYYGQEYARLCKEGQVIWGGDLLIVTTNQSVISPSTSFDKLRMTLSW